MKLPTHVTVDAFAALTFLAALSTSLWKRIKDSHFVRMLKNKQALIGDRDVAVRAAETSRDYAHIAQAATHEYRSLADALSKRIADNERVSDGLKAEVASLGSAMATTNTRLDNLKAVMRISFRHITALLLHIRALSNLLTEHAPEVPQPQEPEMPKELASEMKALDEGG